LRRIGSVATGCQFGFIRLQNSQNPILAKVN
jgi:hypothetical protein